MRPPGSWAMVAGASEGLGAAFAEALAERGYRLVLLARRAEALEAVAAGLRAKTEVVTRALDLSSPGLEAEVRELLGAREVELLVCNAAHAPLGPFEQQPLAEKLKALDVNCRAPVTLCHLVLPGMVARRRGAIVLMSSLTAFQGSPFLAVYGATKAFNASLAEALWAETRGSGVDVLAVCAGATRTPGYLKTARQQAPGELAPRQVVDEALGALGQGPLLIPGAFNRIASFLMRRLMPRAATVRVMGAQTAKLLRPGPATKTG
ncbi:MAG: SDR family NAD(P)-dependent oxidoreductase [Myxococcaceae bacterium]|nr:SDR family NAD(P)-dependent oxidoreductase [Myxococcaceae bacterium]MCA3012494.1 SDR family NAD(P)-dependent oxidoreductase [Myxococcaceae bacterium]